MRDRPRYFLAAIFLLALALLGQTWGPGILQQARGADNPFADEVLSVPRNSLTTPIPGNPAPAADRLTSLLDRLATLLEEVNRELVTAVAKPTTGKPPAVSPGKPGTVRIRTFLNFRRSPWGPVLGKLHDGDRLEILGKEGNWYKVRVNGKIGYAWAKYIRAGGASTSPGKASAGKIPGGSGTSTPRPPANGAVSQGTGSPMQVKATGYYPPPPGGYKTRAEAALEGGAFDCRGQRLRPLQDFNPRDPKSYVSCATDPRVIKTGTWFTLDQYPGVRFLACDVGGSIKGRHIDICCKTRAQTYQLPASVTVRALK